MTRRMEIAGPALVAVPLASAAALVTWLLIGPELLRLSQPAAGFDVDRLVLLYSTLPRLATALLCGAALALAGAILQQATRNPLASPTTLGFSAGANLALALATLFMPALFVFGRDIVALAGSGLSALVVLGLASRRGFSPISVVLAGLIVALYCGAMRSLLVLLNEQYLASLFIWGSGSLAQQDWTIPLSLLPRLGILFLAALLLLRPLALMDLGEAGTRALGLSPRTIRVAGIVVAVGLSAVVASAVGVIGFIGLIAPTVARLAGARRFGSRLFWSAIIGAALLWLTDELIQLVAGPLQAFLPTGAVTALFGSPLLLFLLPRLRAIGRMRVGMETGARAWTKRPGALLPIFLLIAFSALLVSALLFGRSPDGGWAWAGIGDWQAILPWRAPRIVASLAAGGMLAIAGLIIQRLTGNEMASPEMLGVSVGAMLGIMAALYLVAAPSYGQQVTFAAVGAVAVLAAVVAMGGRSGMVPERVLLAGIALVAMLDALVGALAATGDPRAFQMLAQMSGSTYGTGWTAAFVCLASGTVLTALTLLGRRWLDLLPLGPVTAGALGVPVGGARLALYLVAAGLTAAATLVVGPLSFIGLMSPHIARELGLRRGGPQLAGAAIGGAALMVLADWLGRNLAFPYQLPAGLLSALVGAPFLLLLLGRKGRPGGG
ncbi:Fe(3+)-hydroxamate ABC transporter permease FhuB [Inquilinus sp. CAU 1745]|uniref:Fe(3+)-hydroxamate ABC transporter permease FhuB n=1 Tax=Inquilinus sp. CAU 1745 TaxID=3140369 RepID=UPI00325BB40D